MRFGPWPTPGTGAGAEGLHADDLLRVWELRLGSQINSALALGLRRVAELNAQVTEIA